MANRGDCLTCENIDRCNVVTAELVKNSHTCPLFKEVTEPVYMGRLQMMNAYGEDVAIEAMLDRPPKLEELEEPEELEELEEPE